MRKFFALLLLTAGVLIIGASGLCTLVVLKLSWSSRGSDPLGAIGWPLVYGLPPMAVGLALFLIGRAQLRRQK